MGGGGLGKEGRRVSKKYSTFCIDFGGLGQRSKVEPVGVVNHERNVCGLVKKTPFLPKAFLTVVHAVISSQHDCDYSSIYGMRTIYETYSLLSSTQRVGDICFAHHCSIAKAPPRHPEPVQAENRQN